MQNKIENISNNRNMYTNVHTSCFREIKNCFPTITMQAIKHYNITPKGV